jgi:hypothetical protein
MNIPEKALKGPCNPKTTRYPPRKKRGELNRLFTDTLAFSLPYLYFAKLTPLKNGYIEAVFVTLL